MTMCRTSRPADSFLRRSPQGPDNIAALRVILGNSRKLVHLPCLLLRVVQMRSGRLGQGGRRPPNDPPNDPATIPPATASTTARMITDTLTEADKCTATE